MSKKPRKPRKWVMPTWMEPYRHLIRDTGGNPIEELMNDHESNVVINAPRALICVAVKSQVHMLEALQKRGMLAKWGILPFSMEQGGISDRLSNFDDWGERIRPKD